MYCDPLRGHELSPVSHAFSSRREQINSFVRLLLIAVGLLRRMARIVAVVVSQDSVTAWWFPPPQRTTRGIDEGPTTCSGRKAFAQRHSNHLVLLLLFLIFSHFYVGSMCLMRRLHLARSCASSRDNSLSDKSSLMLSNHLRFGHSLLLFPGTSIAITLLPTYSSSLLKTCPYHFNLLSCTFFDITPTFVAPLMLSFLILSSLVTPLIHLNILISATSNLIFCCAFFTAQVSAPYIIAGLATFLYTSP